MAVAKGDSRIKIPNTHRHEGAILRILLEVTGRSSSAIVVDLLRLYGADYLRQWAGKRDLSNQSLMALVKELIGDQPEFEEFLRLIEIMWVGESQTPTAKVSSPTTPVKTTPVIAEPVQNGNGKKTSLKNFL